MARYIGVLEGLNKYILIYIMGCVKSKKHTEVPPCLMWKIMLVMREHRTEQDASLMFDKWKSSLNKKIMFIT